MNTKQLKYVQTLAREGSFSRAADVLGIAQPSLSQYIKKIEQDIGLDLFDRANGSVRITDAGRVYLEAGRKILDIEHQMEVRFSDIGANRSGSLIIGSSPYRAAGMMPAVAAAFQRRHPGIHLVVREGTTAELSEGMEHGAYDLALTLLPTERRLFSYERVMEEELVLAAPGSYPAFKTEEIQGRRYGAIEPRELNGKKLVMLTDTQYMQKQWMHLAADYKIEVSTAAVVKSIEAQIEFVKAGVGVALVPSGIERFCMGSSVRFYSFIPDLPKREVVLVWRKDRQLSAVAEELKSMFHSIEWLFAILL